MSDDWGTDDMEESTQTPAGRAARSTAFGVDISDLAAQLVDAQVKASVKAAVADVAAEAVKAALTEDVMNALREKAAADAEAAITMQLEAEEAVEAELDGAGAAAEASPELYYGSVDEFVRTYLRFVYKRRVGTKEFVWAADWWRYDEAVIRLEALWRAWEHLRLDPATGMSVWFRDHADHHMSVLLSETGPFGAAEGLHDVRPQKGDPLPYTDPPEGMFPDVRVPVAEPDAA
ncbi:DUF4913 domain-containing protein [Agromyces sp. SYSU K20354]|uniref:DUF4913 domain-containing protein n=1 Tax=Agromyces cavernae TaxID=2898659 RepID=UPI001E5E0C88|nr:DUF4913 domain-containing protein [Agromyces cavernae]MCD2444371.1 DUF4913 domain-containing protein [Agromyces cavernae]